MELIRVNDMLKTMQMRDSEQKLIPFQLTFITCDLKQQTGGKRISYDAAVLVGSGASRSDDRNPSHFSNYTRNLKGEGTEAIRKFHPLLVESFNGKTVVL